MKVSVNKLNVYSSEGLISEHFKVTLTLSVNLWTVATCHSFCNCLDDVKVKYFIDKITQLHCIFEAEIQ